MSTINQPQSGPHKGPKDVRKRPSMSVLEPCQIVLLQDSAALRTLSSQRKSQCAGRTYFRSLLRQNRGLEKRYLISAITPSAIKASTSSPNNPMRAMPPPDMQTEVIMISFLSSFVPCVL